MIKRLILLGVLVWASTMVLSQSAQASIVEQDFIAPSISWLFPIQIAWTPWMPESPSVDSPESTDPPAEPTETLNPLENTTPLLWPADTKKVTSVFGMRDGKLHKGVDIGAHYGTPIRCSEDGRVLYAGVAQGYGNMILVQHANHLETRYAHASELDVHVGERVQQGTILGLVGSTGHSTGPHLHFEVIANNQAKDPLKFF